MSGENLPLPVAGRAVATEISSIIPTNPVSVASPLVCDNTDISGVNTLTVTTTATDNLQFKAQNGDTIHLSSLLSKGTSGYRLTSGGDGSVSWVEGSGTSSGVEYNGNVPVSVGKIAIYGGIDGNLIKDSTLSDTDILNKNGDTMIGNLDMNTNNITNVFKINADRIQTSTPLAEMQVESTLRLRGNDIVDVDNLATNINVRTPQIETNTIATRNLTYVEFSNDLRLAGNNILIGGDIQTTSFSSTDFKSNDVDVDCNLDLLGTRNIKNAVSVSTGTLNGGLSPNISVGADLDLQTTQDISNIRSMTITSTQYISRIEDMGTPVGNYYVIPDNTTWIILGQITLEYGIEFGANCSLRGIDFSAQITFDETSRDCDIKAVDNNFYLSQITIVNGGGRFTGTPASVRGLLNAQNYNVGAGAPFYGRNKRFKVTDCNILRPFKIGTVEGFGTLNVTNNFFNGGGGLAGQATSYYTNEGLSVSDGLSLELNNNKMVLMLGAQQVSTLKLLNMKARVSSLLGFNAVTITGNIFHPRSTETGIDFDADSRTSLGNISGNVFIRTGGTQPLINYDNVSNFDNYNPLSIENYSVSANTGVVDSEPILKAAIESSQSISSSTLTKLVAQDNAQFLPMNTSSRFATRLDLTGVTQAFLANERITDTASGSTALILLADAEVGGNQTVYILDQDGFFDASPTTFTSPSGGNATGGSLLFYWRYSEKDPRKLSIIISLDFVVGNNVTFSASLNLGALADETCEVTSMSPSSGPGSTLTVVCAQRFEDGDYIELYASVSSGSLNLSKGLIVIK